MSEFAERIREFEQLKQALDSSRVKQAERDGNLVIIYKESTLLVAAKKFVHPLSLKIRQALPKIK